MKADFDFRIDYDSLKENFATAVYDWIEYWAKKAPDRVAMVDTDRREYSYAELLKLGRIQAINLMKLGVCAGSMVATLETNSVRHFATIFAASLLRATLVPLNWRLTEKELSYMVSDSKPAAILYGEKYRAMADALHYGRPESKVASIPEISEPGFGGSALTSETFDRTVEELTQKKNAHVASVRLHPILILYTSGTTGFPKGAMVSELQVKQNALNTITGWGLGEDEHYILSAPLFHTGGWNVLALPLMMIGGRVVVHEKFDTELILSDIERNHITIYFGVPTMFLFLMESPNFEKTDLSSLRFLITGGAPCPPYIIETFGKRGVTFRQGFGLTEVGPNCFTIPPEDSQRKIGSVGFPMKAGSLKLVDDDGREVGPNCVGEIIIAGDHVCMGYLGREEDYKKANPDGYFRTGDLAMRDPEGYHYIVGRKKEMFISGGENVYPKEIEDRLTMLHDVTEAAVVGIPDPKWGEIGLAAVALRPEVFSKLYETEEATENQMKSHLKSLLAGYKVPKKFKFYASLPKNVVGKIDKKAIREEYIAAQNDGGAKPAETARSN